MFVRPSVCLKFQGPAKTTGAIVTKFGQVVGLAFSNIRTGNDVARYLRSPTNGLNVGIFEVRLRNSRSPDLRNVENFGKLFYGL